MRETTNQIILLSAAAANGASASAEVESFRHVLLELAQVGFTGTIKFVCSNADTPPAFGSAASATNPWDYVAVKDMIDNSSVAGGTGITGTATTSIKNLELNTNGVKWVGAIISGYSAGSVTLKAKGYNE